MNSCSERNGNLYTHSVICCAIAYEHGSLVLLAITVVALVACILTKLTTEYLTRGGIE
jgi:hypothetical protein